MHLIPQNTISIHTGTETTIDKIPSIFFNEIQKELHDFCRANNFEFDESMILVKFIFNDVNGNTNKITTIDRRGIHRECDIEQIFVPIDFFTKHKPGDVISISLPVYYTVMEKSVSYQVKFYTEINAMIVPVLPYSG